MNKVKKKNYNKRYYRKYKKKILKRVKDWVKEHRQKVRKYKKIYARKNKAKIKKYKQKNKAKLQRQAKIWWKKQYKNPKVREHKREVTRKWAKEHPIKRKRNRKKSLRTLRGRYSELKYNSKKRGIFFNLTLNQFSKLIEKPCHYCGVLPWEGVRGSWLDRVINNKKCGYRITNVVPCCGTCNHMKMDLTLREFRKHIKRIVFKLKLS